VKKEEYEVNGQPTLPMKRSLNDSFS